MSAEIRDQLTKNFDNKRFTTCDPKADTIDNCPFCSMRRIFHEIFDDLTESLFEIVDIIESETYVK